MRFKLILENNSAQKVPINYQYPLSAWIYKTFSAANGEFANWLHTYGYAFNGNRKFKLFTFSNLKFQSYSFRNHAIPYLLVKPGKHKLILSFHMEDAAGHFISGLFKDRAMVLAQQNIRAEFSIVSIEQMAPPQFTNPAVFNSMSPIVLSKPQMRGNKLTALYLSPEDKNYSDLLKENLIKKYIAVQQNRLVASTQSVGSQEYLADLPFDTNNWNFKLINTPQSKLQTIKAGTPMETRVRGYLYAFELTAPEELIAIAYDAGVGEKGSLGFGGVEIEGMKIKE